MLLWLQAVYSKTRMWLWRWLTAPHGPTWRWSVIRATYSEFKRPPGGGRSLRGRYVVPRIGYLYYKKTFPQWIMWDYSKPEKLHINTDMLAALLAKEMKLPSGSVDSAMRRLSFVMGKTLMKERFPKVKEEYVPWSKDGDHGGESCDVNAWLRGDSKTNVMTF